VNRLFALLPLLAGCLFDKPLSLSRWHGCLIDDALLTTVAGRQRPDYAIHYGEGHVLQLQALWGVVLFASENSWGTLVLDLPERLRPGDVLSIDERTPAVYMESGMITSYASMRLIGTVEVYEVEARSALLLIDLRATAPSPDLEKLGSQRLRGLVSIKRAATRNACPEYPDPW
jgi:hypothetical protein